VDTFFTTLVFWTAGDRGPPISYYMGSGVMKGISRTEGLVVAMLLLGL
jgi:hypothetical protein